MKKTKMLKATEHNWSLMGPGDWNEIKWEVYYDGSYRITAFFNPSFDEMMKVNHRRVSRTHSGKLSTSKFKELMNNLDSKQWRDPRIDNRGSCDGTAWEVEYYSVSGEILNSSKLDYIYGHECLEKIVSCLPEAEEIYDAPAFISVREV